MINTGETHDEPLPGPGCEDFPLTAGGTATYSGTQEAVVYITFAEQMATSQGIKIGSTRQQVLEAYNGKAFDYYAEMHVPVAVGVSYLIGMDHGRVSELILMQNSQDCAG